MSEPPPSPSEPDPDAGFVTRYAGLPPAGWRASSVGIGLLIAVGLLLAGTIFIAFFDPELDSEAGQDAAQLVVAIALAGTALGYALSDAGGRIGGAFQRLGLTRFALSAIGLAVVAWLAYLGAAALLSPLLSPEQEDITRELGTDEGSAVSIVAAGILIVVVAPLSEELFFRGFMFSGLRRSISLWPAALVSALVWGALHLGGGNVGVVIQLSIFGVILAWLYERSGTLWAPIIAHTINNSIAFTLLVTDVI